MRGDALMRLAQHRLGVVDADDAMRGSVIEQRNAGADPDIEDAPADALGGRDRGLAAGVEHRAEDEVIDRRPARIGLCHRVDVDFDRHGPPLTSTYITASSRMKRQCGADAEVDRDVRPCRAAVRPARG